MTRVVRTKTAVAKFLATLATLLLVGGIALAATPVVGIRTGDHEGDGRVVFDLPPGIVAVPQQQDGRLIVRFDPAATARAGAAAARNVRAIATIDAGVEIAFAPGAQTHITRIDGKLIVDVLDTASASTAPPAPAPRPAAAPAPVLLAAAKLSLVRISPPIDRHDDDALAPSALAAQPATPPAAAAPDPQPPAADWLALTPDAAPSLTPRRRSRSAVSSPTPC
jgi:hypothetical protein